MVRGHYPDRDVTQKVEESKPCAGVMQCMNESVTPVEGAAQLPIEKREAVKSDFWTWRGPR